MTLAVNIAQGGSNNVTMRNRIINGALGIWQRGTSFTSGGSSTYTADRFFGNGSSGTISRSTDVPSGFTYSFSNAASSTAYPGVAQRIESVNIADLASQTITASFWVKQTSGTASALNINLSYPNSVDSWGTSTTIVETNVVATMPSSWTRYSYTYTLPANATNGLSVTLFIPNGSVTATFLITGVQLEAGTTASPFEYRQYGTELALCQRYYQKSGYGMCGRAESATLGNLTGSYIVEMRAAPSGTLLNGTSGIATFGVSTYNISSLTAGANGTHDYRQAVNTTGMTTGAIINGYSESVIGWSAEL